jgi:hypothetical protein
MDCHGTMDVPPPRLPAGKADALDLRASLPPLRDFALALSTKFIVPPASMRLKLANIRHLDVSRNELWQLPGLDALTSLETLEMSRNWFVEFPEHIGTLSRLSQINARHNMLRSSDDALRVCALRRLAGLRRLDIQFNQRCDRSAGLRARLTTSLPQVTSLLVTEPAQLCAGPEGGKRAPDGAFEGASAADRNACLLRAQLEPWGTTVLRRRLCADFGEDPSTIVDPAAVPRAEVMRRLLKRYAEEGLCGRARNLVRAQGVPLSTGLCTALLAALKAWRQAREASTQPRERPSIRAKHYQILTAPSELLRLGAGTRTLERAVTKLQEPVSRRIWMLARRAAEEVDADFARQYTAIAVTCNFRGSPHIDKQNTAPFMALSLGDFARGTGGICVECSARVVCEVDTKGRMGIVDGRYPHWVAPYDESCDRYSVVFYKTAGRVQPVGPAVLCAPVFLQQDPDGGCQEG